MDRLDIDPTVADRLLSGLIAPDDAPPGLAVVAEAVRVARGPAVADELARRGEVVEAMAAVVRRAGQPTTRAKRPPRLERLTTRMAAAGLAVAMVAAGVAAATGSLPHRAQVFVDRAASHLGVDLHVPARHLSAAVRGAVGDTATQRRVPDDAPAGTFVPATAAGGGPAIAALIPLTSGGTGQSSAQAAFSLPPGSLSLISTTRAVPVTTPPQRSILPPSPPPVPTAAPVVTSPKPPDKPGRSHHADHPAKDRKTGRARTSARLAERHRA